VVTAETTIANRREDLSRVTQVVDELAHRHCLTPDVAADLNVALDEVLTNIIAYAYDDDEAHQIWIGFTIDEGAIEAEVVDDGRPFDPTTIPPPDRSASLHDRQVGGLGMHFVRHLMSEVGYTRARGRNHLRLKRRWRR
jgi:serine/threonine-protein kinase RsbW